MNYYCPIILRAPDAYREVWITERWPGNGLPLAIQGGRLVCEVRQRLEPQSDLLAHWWGYALRCCRAWNAKRIAASLAGLEESCPALFLADLMGEQDEAELEAELRWQFTPGRYADGSWDKGIPESPAELRTDRYDDGECCRWY